MTTERLTFRARYVFPCDGAPQRNACLTVQDGLVVAAGAAGSANVIDLGQVAILPGWVNAHTHLEFSQLSAPLGNAEMPFPDWIRRVIAWRNEQRSDADEMDAWRVPAIQTGIVESTAVGVTTLGEIATMPVDPVDRYAEFAGTAFLELLGLRDESHDALIAAAQRFVATFRSLDATGQPGLSPHAPYTVSQKLLGRVVQLSSQQRIPVAMHLAETRDELELLASASGPLCEFLRDVGAWQADAIRLDTRPKHYLELLAKAHRALVIHGNFLTQDEIQLVAQHRDRMSIVYCPRTHAYFGHEPYPLAEMLAAGVRVAIGTDSRASNPDLSVLNELRVVARLHPQVAPSKILDMGTLAAATALGVDDQVGSLTVGKRADFVVVPIAAEHPVDPHELILGSEAVVSAVYRGGTAVTAGNW